MSTPLRTRLGSALFLLIAPLCKASGLPVQEISPDRPPILRPVRYELASSVDFANAVIDAKCRLAVENPYDQAVDRFTFVLYRLLKVKTVKDLRGRPLSFTQEVKAYEDEPKFRANLVEVILSEPLSTGQTASLDIDYAGTLLGYVEAGKTYVKDRIDKDFTFIRMDCLAYPEPGVASWRRNIAAGLPLFDYELAVSVPKGWLVANGGVLVSKTKKEGRVTFRYKSSKPSWRMDAAIARYKVMAEAARSIRVYYFPPDKPGANSVFRGLVESLDLFSRRLGRLEDFRGFTVIEVPLGFGSQADVTSILLTKDAFTDRARLTDLYHEVSHLWSVPARDPLPCRLESEGVAMYLQFWAQEELDKKANAMEAGAARQRERFLKVCREDPKAAGTPIIDYGRADLTDLSYNKGMLFFYILDRLAGREKLLSALAECHRRFTVSGATTDEYMGSLKAALGPDIEPVTRDWVYGVRSSELLQSSLTLDQIAAGYRQP